MKNFSLYRVGYWLCVVLLFFWMTGSRPVAENGYQEFKSDLMGYGLLLVVIYCTWKYWPWPAKKS